MILILSFTAHAIISTAGHAAYNTDFYLLFARNE
jgi:hypothetical protein